MVLRLNDVAVLITTASALLAAHGREGNSASIAARVILAITIASVLFCITACESLYAVLVCVGALVSAWAMDAPLFFALLFASIVVAVIYRARSRLRVTSRDSGREAYD